MAVVEIKNLSKTFRLYHERHTTLKERLVHFGRQKYESFWALKDVTFDVGEGETFGLVGANGSGKTTLLKVIAGILRPSSGRVRTKGRVAALLELGAGFHPDLTGRENVYMNASIMGLTRRETDKYFDPIVAFAELEPFIDNQVKHYSSGMYVRLGFAVAVHVDPEILLVDEVLAVGDEAFQRKCMDKVRQFQREGRTIFFVSHAADFVREICTRAACLHHGDMAALGPPTEVIRTFRELIHRDANLEVAPHEEKGTKRIRIDSVTLQDTEGRRSQLFHAGEDMEILLDLESEEAINEAVVHLVIYDARGNKVFATNSARRQLELPAIQGKQRVRFTLRRIPFLDGSYELTLGVRSRDETEVFHWMERAFPFRAVNMTSDVGPIHVPCELTIEPL